MTRTKKVKGQLDETFGLGQVFENSRKFAVRFHLAHKLLFPLSSPHHSLHKSLLPTFTRLILIRKNEQKKKKSAFRERRRKLLKSHGLQLNFSPSPIPHPPPPSLLL